MSSVEAYRYKVKCHTCRRFCERDPKGCPEAPLICDFCRQDPFKHRVTRKAMELHLQAHRDAGDFDHIREELRTKPGRLRRAKVS